MENKSNSAIPNLPVCPVCGQPMSLRIARGRRSNKPFIMLMCAVDGRHFRGFISHQQFVRDILARLERKKQTGRIID